MSIFNASINKAIALSRAPSIERQITLADNVPPDNPDETDDAPDETDLDGASLSALSRPSTTTRLGRERLRENLARRKYAKYSKDRYEDEEAAAALQAPTSSLAQISRSATVGSNAADSLTGVSTQPSKVKEGVLKRGEDKLRRGQAKVKGLLGLRKIRKANDGEAEIDILWENQRGGFVFGRPYYSSQSLLNFDPPPWTNQHNRPSPVDITNAQLPDPNWEWAWQTWYVDMSLDVDEQGWQYSFMFQNRFPWHGTHPWGYSWARRRRWIRKRVRKHHHLPDGRVAGGVTMKEAHRLNEDYFTIHPSKSRNSNTAYSFSTDPRASLMRPDSLVEDDELDDVINMSSLIKGLKKATTDREKIALVLKFVDEGGQDVHYLATEMPHIMSIFLYQHSRRQLLVGMTRKIDGPVPSPPETPDIQNLQATSTDTASLSPSPSLLPSQGKHSNASSRASSPAMHLSDAQQRRKDLVSAAHAAEEQIRALEYWSDIRAIVQEGHSLNAPDPDAGWDESWQGLERSGPGIGAQEDALHDAGKGKGKEKADVD